MRVKLQVLEYQLSYHTSREFHEPLATVFDRVRLPCRVCVRDLDLPDTSVRTRPNTKSWLRNTSTSTVYTRSIR